jgi:hypothetical protein
VPSRVVVALEPTNFKKFSRLLSALVCSGWSLEEIEMEHDGRFQCLISEG